jgi:hypothetical protein
VTDPQTGAKDNAPAPAPAGGDEPAGIGGWLVLPLIHLMLSAMRISLDIGYAFAEVINEIAADGEFDWEQVTYAFQFLHDGERIALGFTLFCVGIVVYSAFCVVQFFRKKRQVPNLMIGFYLLLGAMMVTNYIILANFPELWTREDLREALKGLLRVAVAMSIWIPYFIVSKRVKNTFVR